MFKYNSRKSTAGFILFFYSFEVYLHVINKIVENCILDDIFIITIYCF